MIITQKEFLNKVTDFITTTGMKETTFGNKAVNDGHFVRRLKSGGTVTLTTAEKVINYIDNYDESAA